MFTSRHAFASTSRLPVSLYTRPLHNLPVELPTIFAPATGRTRSAISILRISGPKSLQIYHKLTQPPKPRLGLPPAPRPSGKGKGKAPEARRALLRRIVDPGTGEVLDEGIVLYFPGECFTQYETALDIPSG
jgi:tRNA modification GTPase